MMTLSQYQALHREIRSTFEGFSFGPEVRRDILTDDSGAPYIHLHTDRVTIDATHIADQDGTDLPDAWTFTAKLDSLPAASPQSWPSALALLANADALIPERIDPAATYIERGTQPCPTWEPVGAPLTGAEVLARIDTLKAIAHSRFHYETGSLTLVQEWLAHCTDHQYHAWTFTPTS
ncbi:hypothetical protein [Streptomyces sp. NPDC001389]|uniref:hypothetical protein n=1 Tax=Streptomyces sp. NPDC001389 TaxID=3364569 RepID=UPI0036818DEB